jgi:aspartate racemase
MKKIGIIGGIGPESTLDYYRGIIDGFRERSGVINSPDIILYSANLGELVQILESQDLERLTDWLLAKVEALQRSGADFVAIASNTPHVVFEQLSSRSPLPLLSIVEAASAKASALGLQRPGLLGTRFTMQADFFQRQFSRRGMSVAIPSENEQQFIHEKLFSEIELGIFKDSTREELLALVKTMIERDGIDSIILGCTELPLILPEQGHGIPFLNTTAIHVASIVEYCLAGNTK